MNKRISLAVTGRVQGVCYRMCAGEEAFRLGLVGWVRNTPGGGVEIVAEGEETKLGAFIKWCRSGPPDARVGNVNIEWSDASGEFKTFAVRYSGG